MKPKFRLHVGRTLFKNVYGLISHISTLKVMNTGRLITLAAFFGLLSAASIPASFQKLMREDMAAQLDEVGLVKAPSLRFEGEAGATEQVVNAGKPVELRCEAYGNPLPVVYWSRNGKPVLSEKPESNWFEKFTNMGSRTYQEGSTVALMRIPCASDLHAAMYTCVAENGHKRIERNVKLIVGDGKRNG